MLPDCDPRLAAVVNLHQVRPSPGDQLRLDRIALDGRHDQGRCHGLGAAGVVCDQRRIRKPPAQIVDTIEHDRDGRIQIVRGHDARIEGIGCQPRLGWDVG